MSGQNPQVLPRRGNHGRPRSANESGRGKGSENANKAAKDKNANDKGSETTGKSETAKPARSKPQNEGEKLVVRRLPPGMTEPEFVSILGPEWENSKGKVDWFSYSQGKVSKDPSKPSRPSRAYIHVMRKDDIMPLSETVRSKAWEDAKGTFTSPSLLAPPSVEFSIYKKVPSNKKRTDTRQGTIDQDPEFMAFLESLANPIQPKDIEAEDDGADKTEDKVTTTPLIEYLKEKKANKGKDGSSKKKDKNAQSEGKGKGSKDDESTKKKGKGSKEDKGDKPKETVKILTKKAATEQAADAAKNAAGQINAANNADAPKSRRAGIAAAARILQRDLGLSPGSAHRRARQDAAKADADAKAETKATPGKDAAPAGNAAGGSAAGSERPASPAPSDGGSQPSKAKSQSGRRNRGGKNADKGKSTEAASTQSAAAPNPPVILKKKPETEGTQPGAAPEPTSGDQASPSKTAQNALKTSGNKPQGQKKPASVSPDATRAFVKHANASQGVNDTALKEALEIFGAVTLVEIDKRKGFAYVDFAEHDGLVKAIAASPVTVGQGSVQVLERKDKKPANQQAGGASNTGTTSEKNDKGSGRGRRGRGGGGGKNAANDKAQAAAPAANNNGNNGNSSNGGAGG